MTDRTYLMIKQSPPLHGTLELIGAKNAVLVIIASLLLARGASTLRNVPRSADVLHMIALLEELGAIVCFDTQAHTLSVDTSNVTRWQVSPAIMGKMRASVLVMGPLLALFGRADIALPGGCVIGQRPIDLHCVGFEQMGATISQEKAYLTAHALHLKGATIFLDYPSVGATENIMMAAVKADGVTRIINAALEPEVMDLIAVLTKMGACIEIQSPGMIIVTGVQDLYPVDHTVIMDRLEAGALLLAAAITGGSISLAQAPAFALDAVIAKLDQMGHSLTVGTGGIGIQLTATKSPRAVSFKTAPYPGFPTDLQAPMMALQCFADGESVVEETVFENRLLHVHELAKMGAHVSVHHNTARIKGVDRLTGTHVVATDIRASCALMLAGLVAHGTTTMTGVSHWLRGYDNLEHKLTALGANIVLHHEKNDGAALLGMPSVGSHEGRV
jgi:UDP-N-acetylglucosamine 1-carboxyvinyltransferase